MRQVVDTLPSSCCLSSVLPCSVLRATAEVEEVLLHRTLTERTNSTGLLMLNKVQYTTVLQRRAVCDVKANKEIFCSFPEHYLSCTSVHVCASQSPELLFELSSPAAFQFFLLFFFEFGPESLRESCFRFL